MKAVQERSLNLFLSYGHEETTQWLVDEIKIFFERERHHHVWRDKELIRNGADWRREIIDGINTSNTMLALLTDYAIGKEHAVCLDELRISVSIPGMNVISVLLEPEKDLDIPCTISRNQYIDMSDWKSKMNTPDWESYFNEKMLTLSEWIESEEHFQFQGEITTVKSMLLPDISECKYYSLLEKELVGREWLSREFDSWLLQKEKFLLIKGGAGTGKSHFSANKVHYNTDVIATYFCEFDKINDNTCKNFIRSISFQIATKIPDYRYWVINGNEILDKNDVSKNLAYFDEVTEGELFSKLINEPLSKTINGNIGNKCILIDGIDEATKNNRNPIVSVLIENVKLTPQWVKFAITSRDEEEILHFFHGYPTISLENEKSKEDIIRYISGRLNAEADNSIVNEIASKSEYMFIFAEKYCDAYLSGLIKHENIPNNIGGLYYYYFKRLFPDDKYKVFRKAISVIVGFDLSDLNEEAFKQVMDYNYEEYHKFLSEIKSFIKIDRDGKRNNIRFYHKSIKDWLVCEEQSGMFYIDVSEGRKIICEFGEMVITNPYEYDYDILKMAYAYIKAYGSVNQKLLLNNAYVFLINLQRMSYENTDIGLFKDICAYFRNIASMKIKGDRIIERSCATSYFLECQFEIDRDNKKVAHQMLLHGVKKYKKVLKEDFCLDMDVKENIFWAENNSVKKQKDMLKLIKKAERKTEKNRNQILSNLYFSYSTYLYAERGYEKALTYIEKAVENAKLVVDEKSQKNTLLRIFNQKGACLSRLNRHDEAVVCLETSLKMRLEAYGTYNHYTAIGYDALARGYLYKAEREGLTLKQDVEKLAKMALKINNTLFGENNKMSARNLFTISKIKSVNKEYDQALEYAEKSRDIYKQYEDVSAINMIDTFIEELKIRL